LDISGFDFVGWASGTTSLVGTYGPVNDRFGPVIDADLQRDASLSWCTTRWHQAAQVRWLAAPSTDASVAFAAIIF
jgi:hypothetical protein